MHYAETQRNITAQVRLRPPSIPPPPSLPPRHMSLHFRPGRPRRASGVLGVFTQSGDFDGGTEGTEGEPQTNHPTRRHYPKIDSNFAFPFTSDLTDFDQYLNLPSSSHHIDPVTLGVVSELAPVFA